MDEFAKVIAPGTLRIARLLPGPIERVWAYLTEPDKRAKWFAGGPMELRAGGSATLRFNHADLSSEKIAPKKYQNKAGTSSIHEFTVLITRCEPPHLLTYTWPEGGEKNSEVTFELSAQGDDVLLLLTHRNVTDLKSVRSFAGGWHSHLGILEDVLHGREPRPFWSTHARVEAEYARRLD